MARGIMEPLEVRALRRDIITLLVALSEVYDYDDLEMADYITALRKRLIDSLKDVGTTLEDKALDRSDTK